MTEPKRFIYGGGPAADELLEEWRNSGVDSPLAELIELMAGGHDLSPDDTARAMEVLMNGLADELSMAVFLAALGTKGITLDELVAMARSMREFAARIEPDTTRFIGTLADTCGTGGDFRETFNISTASAFVLAAADVPVAKHGNRSVTSRCGSADVLEALGAVIDLEPPAVRQCIETVGIGFLFAPRFHSSMRHVAGARKLLAGRGLRSAFNLLGPLTNPAGAKAQLLGVFDMHLADMFAEALGRLGCDHALCVYGSGYDELSIEGTTRVVELDANGSVRTYDVDLESVELERPADVSLAGGRDAVEGAAILTAVLDGASSDARRTAALLNAGAAIYIGHPDVTSIREGITRARDIIGSGAARMKLDEFIAATQELER